MSGGTLGRCGGGACTGGGEEKNSITNRLHLHGFHQPISSCQTELLLIGLEGKRTEERAWRTTWEAELRTAGCSCLINQSGVFFFFFAVLRAAELTRSSSLTVIQTRYRREHETSVCVCVCVHDSA